MCLADLFDDVEFEKIRIVASKYDFDSIKALEKCELIYFHVQRLNPDFGHGEIVDNTLLRLENYLKAYNG